MISSYFPNINLQTKTFSKEEASFGFTGSSATNVTENCADLLVDKVELHSNLEPIQPLRRSARIAALQNQKAESTTLNAELNCTRKSNSRAVKKAISMPKLRRKSGKNGLSKNFALGPTLRKKLRPNQRNPAGTLKISMEPVNLPPVDVEPELFLDLPGSYGRDLSVQNVEQPDHSSKRALPSRREKKISKEPGESHPKKKSATELKLPQSISLLQDCSNINITMRRHMYVNKLRKARMPTEN